MLLNLFNLFFSYFLFSYFLFNKEWIIINEEFLIILSFLVVFFALVFSLNLVLIQELDLRNINIKNNFNSLYINKKNTIINIFFINFYKNFTFITNLYLIYFFLLEINLIIDLKNKINEYKIKIYTKQLLNSFIIKINLENLSLYLTILKNIFIISKDNDLLVQMEKSNDYFVDMVINNDDLKLEKNFFINEQLLNNYIHSNNNNNNHN